MPMTGHSKQQSYPVISPDKQNRIEL